MVEFGSQVTIGMVEGKTITQAVMSVDKSDIAVAAVAGAATGGISLLRNAGTATKVAIAVGEDVIKTRTGERRAAVSGTGIVISVGTSGFGETAAGIAKKAAQNTDVARSLRQQASRAENIANSGRARESQTRRAQQARAAATNYGGGNVANSVQNVGQGATSTAAQAAEKRRQQAQQRKKE